VQQAVINRLQLHLGSKPQLADLVLTITSSLSRRLDYRPPLVPSNIPLQQSVTLPGSPVMLHNAQMFTL